MNMKFWLRANFHPGQAEYEPPSDEFLDSPYEESKANDFDSLHRELKAINTNWRSQLRDGRGVG